MARKAKKRGVKPGTKRGPYNKNKILTLDDFSERLSETSLPSLISELSSTISTLENQLANEIDRIKSLLQ